MRLYISQIMGMPVRDRASRGLLGRVVDFLVHPETGAVIALFLHSSRKLLVQPSDVLRVDGHGVWVAHPDAVAASGDIVRVQQVLALEIPVRGNRVFTVSRQHLGAVLDILIETKTWQLQKLIVGKKILGVITSCKHVAANDIVQIKKTEITVRDATIKTSAKALTNNTIATGNPAQAVYSEQK